MFYDCTPFEQLFNEKANPISRAFQEELVDSLRPLNPTKILIFGSAIEKGLRARDLDLVVVSDQFANVLWHRRRSMVLLPLGPKYDLTLLTELEFQSLSSSHPLKLAIKKRCLCLEGHT